MNTAASPQAMLAYTHDLLDQMARLTEGHDLAADGPFADYLGPHLRHILEHYQALACKLPDAVSHCDAVMAYDQRARDLAVQTEPAAALACIAQLRRQLASMAAWPDEAFARGVKVTTQAGSGGEFQVDSRSTWLRELVFLGSHCVHHFAVIKLQALQRGKDLGTQFGKAPSTVAHESGTAAAADAASRAPMRPAALPWHRPIQAVVRPGWAQGLRIRWGRLLRWEFWPSWLYYGPIVLWILRLGVKYGHFMAFTAANPGLEAGGMVGERKHQALEPLQNNAPDLVARFVLLTSDAPAARTQQALAFAQEQGFPVVLKPDVGQRGRGVHVARSPAEVQDYLTRFAGDVIAQRYVGGQEYGVFVARQPGQRRVQLLSIVHKTFPSVTGDGHRSLRELILADARARLIAGLLFIRWAAELGRVPAAGEAVQLVEIGAHCRGSLFLDARHLATAQLCETLERLLDAVPGYSFGRMDLRVPSAEHLQRGEGLQVLELNGVAAESAHIYHPGTPLLEGYRAMFQQWALAFEIGAAHMRAGARPTSAPQLRLWRQDIQRGATWF